MSNPTLEPYCVTQEEAAFDWNAFLAQLEYTAGELHHANYLSSEWVTCAVGNQCAAIPRTSGIPDDHTLYDLGHTFTYEIGRMQLAWVMGHPDKLELSRRKAIATLHLIEQRSAEILHELSKS